GPRQTNFDRGPSWCLCAFVSLCLIRYGFLGVAGEGVAAFGAAAGAVGRVAVGAGVFGASAFGAFAISTSMRLISSAVMSFFLLNQRTLFSGLEMSTTRV